MSGFPRFFYLTFILLVLMIVMSNNEIIAQETLKVDVNTKEEVVKKVADFMKDYYVFPIVGKEMGDYIKKKHSNSNYDGYTDVKEICNKVTADLREICHDKHIFVFYSPEEAREVAARNGLLPAEEIEKINNMYFEMDRRTNLGFSKVEILDGNIGYLSLNSFSGSDYACETAVGAIRFLSCSDAIIIDLRNNGGGGGGVGSLKHLKRATIIGETTKGGAHPVDVMIVKGNILTQISIGNSVNPITKSNWEGIGVKPDVEVSAEKALHTAHHWALKNLLKKTTNDELKQELKALIKRME